MPDSILEILLDTNTLNASANTIKPAESFLVDNIFNTQEINADDKITLMNTEGNVRIAQLVHPNDKHPKTVDILHQEGAQVKIPMTWEEKVFTVEMLEKFEAIKTLYRDNPQAMDNAIIDRVGEEILDLENRVVRLQEVMGGSLLTTGKILIAQKGFDLSIDFGFQKDKQKETLSGADLWSSTDANIPTHILAWKKKAKGATDVIVGTTAANNLFKNKSFLAALDSINYKTGVADMTNKASEAATFLGNPFGLNWWEYHQDYEDKTGAIQPIIGIKQAIMINRNKRFPMQIAPVKRISDDNKTLSAFFGKYYLFPKRNDEGTEVSWQLSQKSLTTIFDMDAIYTVQTSA